MPKIELSEKEKKEQKAKVDETKKKQGRPFKVTDQGPNYEILHNAIFKHLLSKGTWPDEQIEHLVERFGSSRFFKRDFTEDYYDVVFGSKDYIRFNYVQVLNVIKILANEGKVRLGQHNIFNKRTIKCSPGFVWCSGCNEYEWVELLALRGC